MAQDSCTVEVVGWCLLLLLQWGMGEGGGQHVGKSDGGRTGNRTALVGESSTPR